MLKNLLSSIYIVLFVSLSFGQKKDLTLEQAVLNQYRGFAPTKMAFFQWIPETEEYTFLDGYTTLKKGSVKSKEAKQLFTIQDYSTSKQLSINSSIRLYWKAI